MTPERMAGIVVRWARFYTRDLPAPIAERRLAELDADLHDTSPTSAPTESGTAGSRATSRPGWPAALQPTSRGADTS